ncbi:MAG TPA: 50S ribosomal protein L25 [Bacillota bacterium]|jgi:large subunit ribosomal protein L25
MEQVLLQAAKRETGKGSAHATRREGYVPAVLYGKGVEAVAVKVPAKDFGRVLNTRAGRNSIIRLAIGEDGAVDERTCMVKDVQQDPVRGDIVHADFYQISLKDRLRTVVPIRVVGEELAQKGGGILQHQLWEIEVECLPTNIPDHLVADVSTLAIGHHLSVADLKIPEGVEVVTELDTVVASLVAPKAVEEEVKPEAAAESADRTQPEVIGKGKEEAEGEAPGKEVKGKSEK